MILAFTNTRLRNIFLTERKIRKEIYILLLIQLCDYYYLFVTITIATIAVIVIIIFMNAFLKNQKNHSPSFGETPIKIKFYNIFVLSLSSHFTSVFTLKVLDFGLFIKLVVKYCNYKFVHKQYVLFCDHNIITVLITPI